jgi:hypothetical protein
MAARIGETRRSWHEVAIWETEERQRTANPTKASGFQAIRRDKQIFDIDESFAPYHVIASKLPTVLTKSPSIFRTAGRTLQGRQAAARA